MNPEAYEAWKYDDAMARKAMMAAWEKREKEIKDMVRKDEAKEPYSIQSKKPDFRPHKMELSETVKRNLAACMTLSTYLP